MVVIRVVDIGRINLGACHGMMLGIQSARRLSRGSRQWLRRSGHYRPGRIPGMLVGLILRLTHRNFDSWKLR
jgi:hypothetical protein